MSTTGLDLDLFLCVLAALAAILIGILLKRVCRPRFPLRFRAKVAWVFDGDTIRVKRWLGRSRKIRLLGMDAPEMEQPYGREARALLRELVAGKRVSVEAQHWDMYGRWVSRVHVDGEDVSLLMIKAGLAWPYYAYFRNLTDKERTLYENAAHEARLRRLGLWSQKRPEAPWDWRRRHRSLWQKFIFWLKRILGLA